MSKTLIAQYAANLAVHASVATAASAAITSTTSLEEDDLTVSIPSNVVGWYVASKVRPQTDALVVKVASKVMSVRSRFTK